MENSAVPRQTFDCIRHPKNQLILVHGIKLDRAEQAPTASGGNVKSEKPWKLDPQLLKPLFYQYQITFCNFDRKYY